MKKQILVLTLLFLILSVFASADLVQICSNKGLVNEICFQVDNNVLPQNINLFEGENDNHNLYVETASVDNPAFDWKRGLFSGSGTIFLQNKLDKIIVNPDELIEGSQLEFKSYTDFYNYLQQENAIGNVSLFTTKDLNQLTRDYNSALNVKTWSLISSMLFLIIEFTKLLLYSFVLFGSAYLFFKFLPFTLSLIKKFIFWMVIKLGGNE